MWWFPTSEKVTWEARTLIHNASLHRNYSILFFFFPIHQYLHLSPPPRFPSPFYPPLSSLSKKTQRTNTKSTQFNRPKALNSFGGNLIQDTVAALRVLNSHPDTIFTVITGAGRFFSAGADVNGVAGRANTFKNEAEKKISLLTGFSASTCAFFLCCSLFLLFFWWGSV